MTTIQAVIVENRALVARIRELNTRAGRDVFPIPTREQLSTGVAQILDGVSRLADIRFPETLRLPALDAIAEAEVLALCPDTIVVCGRAVAVEYRASYYGTARPPLVRMDFRGELAKDWLQLPEGGVKLPDGREVALYSAIDGYGYYVESPSSQFKAKVCECLNQGLWDVWAKPALAVPDPSAEFPALEVQEYGRCVVTSEPLVAYGVLYHDYYSSWKTAWYRDRVEAEGKHAEGSAKWIELREKSERDELKKRIRTLMDQWYYVQDFDEAVRKRLYNTVYGYTGAAQTVVDLKALIAEAEVAVAIYEAKKAEAERMKREAEARLEAVEMAIGDLLDGGYADGYVWVSTDGDVAYILGGKISKMGDFVVTPWADADVPSARPYCFGDYKYQAWVPFSYGVRSKVQDFSRSGNVQSEVVLFLREGVLEPGVYGVASDGEGQFFYPVIHHTADGTEVVPEVSAVKKYRSPKEVASVAKGTGKPASMDALAALAAKFGP